MSAVQDSIIVNMKVVGHDHENGDNDDGKSEDPISQTKGSALKLKLDLNKVTKDIPQSSQSARKSTSTSTGSDIPLTAPHQLRSSREGRKRSKKTKNGQQGRTCTRVPLSARGPNRSHVHNRGEKRQSYEKIDRHHVKYSTPRLDELPLSLRLHSNPIVLIQSLRRQKRSNYNMFAMKACVDNKIPRNLRLYAERRNRLRTVDPHPELPVPIFLRKQFTFDVLQNKLRKHRQHLQRVREMQPHIDNQLPKQILHYRRMRRQRLRNAQKRARHLHEQRLQSPEKKAPRPPSYSLPKKTQKIVSAVRQSRIFNMDIDLENLCKTINSPVPPDRTATKRTKMTRKGLRRTFIETLQEEDIIEEERSEDAHELEQKSETPQKSKKVRIASNTDVNSDSYQGILYINSKTALTSKFSPSPKPKKPATFRRQSSRVLVQALPCHFQDWKK